MSDWEKFAEEIKRVMQSRGHGYVRSASHPAPEAAQIVGDYSATVTVGPAGYETKHGQRHELG